MIWVYPVQLGVLIDRWANSFFCYLFIYLFIKNFYFMVTRLRTDQYFFFQQTHGGAQERRRERKIKRAKKPHDDGCKKLLFIGYILYEDNNNNKQTHHHHHMPQTSLFFSCSFPPTTLFLPDSSPTIYLSIFSTWAVMSCLLSNLKPAVGKVLWWWAPRERIENSARHRATAANGGKQHGKK